MRSELNRSDRSIRVLKSAGRGAPSSRSRCSPPRKSFRWVCEGVVSSLSLCTTARPQGCDHHCSQMPVACSRHPLWMTKGRGNDSDLSYLQSRGKDVSSFLIKSWRLVMQHPLQNRHQSKECEHIMKSIALPSHRIGSENWACLVVPHVTVSGALMSSATVGSFVRTRRQDAAGACCIHARVAPR
jgi:hypothetical protein